MNQRDFDDDYAPENQSVSVSTALVEKRCHGCGQLRQIPIAGAYCRSCFFQMEQGMDLGFHDDLHDEGRR